MKTLIPTWAFSVLKWVLLLEASVATALLIDWWWTAA